MSQNNEFELNEITEEQAEIVTGGVVQSATPILSPVFQALPKYPVLMQTEYSTPILRAGILVR